MESSPMKDHNNCSKNINKPYHKKSNGNLTILLK